MITVDDRTRKVQRDATDPEASVWVSANAGSGKTYVLARRVIRLLLSGTDPGAILCLTFTKAAAAEMAARVFDILAGWTTLEDAALDTVLADYQGGPPDEARRLRARRLFARALETPGGLKIQTIHAFCERLLHQFPFEANVAGSFEVLDDRAAAVLTDQARRSVLARAAASPESSVGQAFYNVLERASDSGIEEALAAILAERDTLREWLVELGSLEAGLASLRAALALAPGDDEAGLRARIADELPFSDTEVARLVAELARSGVTHQKAGERLAPFATAKGAEARAEIWLDYLMTGDRKKVREIRGLAAKAILDQWPGLEERLAAERLRIEHLLDRIAAASAFEATAALLTLGDAVIAAYETEKRLRGALDFQDLVVRTADLLSRSGASAWVHFKLDRGLDHILVDEAQDTSPRQWQVIAGLADEFFAGKGMRDAVRTFFAVGDEKQSIYSFQGAVPAWFARQRRRIGSRARNAGTIFHELELQLSFRSTADVLGAVDKVFRAEHAHRGLTRDPQPTVHQAARRGDPGRVTLWPPIAAERREEPEEWHAPLDRLDDRSPEVRLAERIAATIARWRDRHETIEATGKPIRAGGILILTRKRGAQTDAINRALKAHGLAVAGADRLALGSHIAVLDLLALADFVLQPRDDLALAALLKSPLVGLAEEDLFALAHDRPATLWQAVERSAVPAAITVAERLRDWRDRVDVLSPYAFFARILGPDGGRRRLLARLGPEADDVLDEFLAQALAYGEVEAPSLQGFVAWMRSAATEIKRDSDVGRDEIRVMTVHGAKGLEADVVFLVDTGSKPVHSSHDPKIVALADDPEVSAGAPLAWIAPGAPRPQRIERALEDLREKAREEYRRLLYVGLTRARDRLIVCGTQKLGAGSEPLWQDLVQAALATEAERVEVAFGDDRFESLEWRLDGSRPPHPPAAPDEPPARAAIVLPSFLSQPPPPAPARPRRLTPSTAVGFAEAEPAFPAVTALDAKLDPTAGRALDRGRIIHRLLQALPDHAPENRRAAATAYLGAVASGWTDDEREGLADRVLSLIEDARFAELFGPSSRAEVPIAGTLDTPTGRASVSGRIDRLVVLPDRVRIVDYKTNRPAPASLEAVPKAHLVQLALYRAVLGRLYPDRRIDAALVWTEVPSLMAIPASSLDEHISRITGS